MARAWVSTTGAVGRLLRFHETLVVVARELAVDRQPERRAIVAPTRQLDRELDARAGAGHGLDVGRVLLQRQRLLEQCRQLHLAEHAACLDVVEDPIEGADVVGQRLHLADAAVHLLEPFRHLAEALAETLLERRVKLLVDGGADLLEFLLVVDLDGAELALDGRRAPRPCAGRSTAPAPAAAASAPRRDRAATPLAACPAQRASRRAIHARAGPGRPAPSSTGRARPRSSAASPPAAG